MRSPVRLTLFVIAAIALLGFTDAVAFADAETTTSPLAHAWTVFLHGFNIVAPWLVVAGLPSIITALTAYPKADGFVKVLKVLLNLLSALTHKDSPGTMKLPLTMSKPPVGSLHPGPMVSTSVILPFLVPLFFLGIASCGPYSPAVSQFGTSYGQCMKQKGLAVALDPKVEQEGLAILGGGTSQQQVFDDLEGLAGRLSVDGVTCLVQSWLSQKGAALNQYGVAGGRAFIKKYESQAISPTAPRY